jgi:hypothetical protein
MVLPLDHPTVQSKHRSRRFSRRLPPYMDKVRALLGISRPSSPTQSERRESNVARSTYAALAASSKQNFSTSNSDDSGPSKTRMATPGPKCFRIANVPLDWTQETLLQCLTKIDPSLERCDRPELSLYPACYGPTQTALLNLRTCTDYFQQLKPNDFNHVLIPNTVEREFLVIDSHFYDLTPLNSPVEGVAAELVSSCPTLPCSR